jgi:DNA-binding winged helix-turn-helix (wHTH) protein
MPPIDPPGAKELYAFGPFRVDPEKQLLLRGNDPVPLTPKAFQVLLVLLRRGQDVVTKDDLMKAVWPDTFVEEGNLSRTVFMLRKALGDSAQDRFIVTIPGRGYRFAEQVRVARVDPAVNPQMRRSWERRRVRRASVQEPRVSWKDRSRIWGHATCWD